MFFKYELRHCRLLINRAIRSTIVLSSFAAGLAVLPTSAQAPVDIRIALVIGNSAYEAAPLINPANDARAMSETLRTLGFTVIELRDAEKTQMTDAITKIRDSLKGKQGIGMLYYAGHGLQLDWHNYMVPVDAKLSKASDVAPQTIDLNLVMDAFKTAGNRMNILVLDACRNNPFSNTASSKGLAPVDAPPSTFLAYATAPGNVAEDGDEKSGNGLYTQFLLQELKKPTAKIEDVFKRVRLNVRQKSEGRQTPWESTSLEEDFYFNAGLKATKKESDSDKEKTFALEKADWDKIKDSKKADDFYAFLKTYPSGYISQQATFVLQQLQASKVIAQAPKGEEVQNINEAKFHAGDTYEYVIKDGYTDVEKSRGKSDVVRIENGLVYMSNQDIYTLIGGTVKNRGNTFDPPRQDLPADEFAIGKKWNVRNTQINPEGRKFLNEAEIKIVAYEDVTVPAGTFKAYKFQMYSWNQFGNQTKLIYWTQPNWGRPIKMLREIKIGKSPPDKEIIELVSRTRGPG
jgi:Caspase domain